MTEGVKFARLMAYYGYAQNNIQSQIKIVCPFHEDINPSMILDFEKGRYYCFGCQSSGNAIDFIMQQASIDKLDACRKLAKVLNDKSLSDIKERKYTDRESDEDLLNRAKDYYYCLSQPDWRDNNLPEYIKCCREYLNKRGLSNEMLNTIQARYTFNKNYPVVFPILDNNNFKGWVCRTTDKETEAKRKYLYNKGFSRYTTLSGTYDNKTSVFICEGTFDKYALQKFGCKNVVAILGWKITEDQINKLKEKGIKHVISVLDNDKCGKQGTIYLSRFFNVTRWQYLKGIKDPGEFNKETFTKMFNKTKIIYMKGNKKNEPISRNQKRCKKERWRTI